MSFKPTKSLNELRESLSETLEDLKSGKINRNDAMAITNMAGKIITSAKVQVDYMERRNTKEKIDYLEPGITLKQKGS